MLELPSAEEPYRIEYVNPALVITARPKHFKEGIQVNLVDRYRRYYGIEIVFANGFTRMYYFETEQEASNMLAKLREW